MFPRKRAESIVWIFYSCSSFLRGQNAPVDAITLAEREARRQQAVELQQALLQQVIQLVKCGRCTLKRWLVKSTQLAEKENKKLQERRRQMEEERREEEKLHRHLEMERQRYEEEQRRIKEKKVNNSVQLLQARCLNIFLIMSRNKNNAD